MTDQGAKFTGLVDWLALTVRTRPWMVVILTTLLMFALAAGGRFVNVTNDYRVMFGEDNPELAAFTELENTYSSSNTALIAIAPDEGTVFTRNALAVIEELTLAAWQVPYSYRVDSLTNYSHSQGYEDDLEVYPLVEDALILSDEDLQRIRAIALDSVDLSGRLVAIDGEVGGIAINFSLPVDKDRAIADITSHMDQMIEEARESNPGFSFYQTGDIPLSQTLADATNDDFLVLAPVAFMLIIASAVLLLRSLFGTAAIILVTLYTIISAMGFAGWLRVTFSPLSSIVPIIVMAIAVAHSVHIVTSVIRGLGEGMSRDEAVEYSLHSNSWPMFLTTVTTVIGFLCLNASDSPPFHDLGNFVAFGVLCAFFFSMTLLPALLLLVPLRGRKADTKGGEFFEKLGDFVINRRRVVLWSSAILVVVLAGGIPKNELTDAWAHYFDDRYEFRRDTDFILENMTGLDMLEYSLDSGSEGGITNPEYLKAVDQFAEWFRSQPDVGHVRAFPDIMKRLNKNMNGEDPAAYRLPEDPQLAAQYLLLYELSLPFGIDLNNRIDIAKSKTRMTVVVGTVSSRDHRLIDERAQEWLRLNHPQFTVPATGVTMIFAHISERNIESMLSSTIVAMVLISMILIFVFRSVTVGLISLVPNLIPAVMSFGTWGFFVGKIGISASVVTIVAFGIIVDDTIHFLSKYLKARKELKLDAPNSVRYAMKTVGQALWITTAVLSIGFLVFATSGYVGSWALGLLLTITLCFALVADFLLLPALLATVDRKKA